VKLVVCTPSRGSVSLGYRDTFNQLSMMCADRGVDFDVFDETLPNELHQARNLLLYKVAEELDEEDWAWFQDSDVSLRPELVFDLMGREEEIIARAYPIKPYADHPPTWSAFPIMPNAKTIYWSEDKKLIQAESFGFGAVMMRATLAKKCQEKFGVRGKGAPRTVNRSIPAFDLIENEWGILCGEDMSFCHRCREMLNTQLWIAPDGWVQNGSAGGIYLDEIKATVGLPEGVGGT
jgi:hypothetical protein